MCPLSPAPDAIFVPWPWEAPWNWLGFAAVVAVLVWALLIRRPRQWFDNRYFRTAGPFKLKMARAVGIFSSVLMFIVLIVIAPSMQRGDTWYHGQLARFSQRNCDLNALFTIESHLQQPVIIWVFVMLGICWGASLLLLYASLRLRT